MKIIEQMRFSQMNPSHSSTCTIGGGHQYYLLKIPQNHVVKNKIYTSSEKVGGV